jgi:beta-phosphoglucomutase-like phosphatase (HAD superfamily)
MKAKHADLERQRARREADLDLARRTRDEALVELKERYGCATIEEAKALVEQLRREIETETARVEQELAAADA